jgi:8-oxo-dGTP diphosphatase
LVRVDDGVEVPVPADGELWTVGAVILNARGKAFAQKRSANRRIQPNCWDIVGGHVEPGETLLRDLAREVTEETGWRLRRLRRVIDILTWTGEDGRFRHEADYLVEVDGDLDHPALEWSKITTYGWFGTADLPRLKENRPEGDTVVHDLIARVLADG